MCSKYFLLLKIIEGITPSFLGYAQWASPHKWEENTHKLKSA